MWNRWHKAFFADRQSCVISVSELNAKSVWCLFLLCEVSWGQGVVIKQPLGTPELTSLKRTVDEPWLRDPSDCRISWLTLSLLGHRVPSSARRRSLLMNFQRPWRSRGFAQVFLMNPILHSHQVIYIFLLPRRERPETPPQMNPSSRARQSAPSSSPAGVDRTWPPHYTEASPCNSRFTRSLRLHC